MQQLPAKISRCTTKLNSATNALPSSGGGPRKSPTSCSLSLKVQYYASLRCVQRRWLIDLQVCSSYSCLIILYKVKIIRTYHIIHHVIHQEKHVSKLSLLCPLRLEGEVRKRPSPTRIPQWSIRMTFRKHSLFLFLFQLPNYKLFASIVSEVMTISLTSKCNHISALRGIAKPDLLASLDLSDEAPAYLWGSCVLICCRQFSKRFTLETAIDHMLATCVGTRSGRKGEETAADLDATQQ